MSKLMGALANKLFHSVMQLVNELLFVQELEVLASGLSDDSTEVLAFILFGFSVLE